MLLRASDLQTAMLFKSANPLSPPVCWAAIIVVIVNTANLVLSELTLAVAMPTQNVQSATQHTWGTETGSRGSTCDTNGSANTARRHVFGAFAHTEMSVCASGEVRRLKPTRSTKKGPRVPDAQTAGAFTPCVFKLLGSGGKNNT